MVALVACALAAIILVVSERAGSAASTPQTLFILELDGANKLAFAAVANPDLKIVLTAENRGAATAKGVSVQISHFAAPTGELADAKVAPASVDVPSGGTRQFIVSATFPSAATTFTGFARVMQQGKLLFPFKIEVARVRAKPPIDVGDLAAIQETARVGHRPLDVPLKMKVYATGGASNVPRPILHSATRKPKADSAAGEAAEAGFDVSGLPDPIVVSAGNPTDIAPRVTGLRSPGRYDLKLRFTPAGFDVLEKDATIYVRDPAFLAFGWIALGVLVSLAVHAYGRTIRPRMLLEKRVAALLRDLQSVETSAADPDGKQLAADVRGAVTRQWDDAASRRQPLAPQIDLYEQIVPALRAWTDLHDKTVGVRPRSVQQKLLAVLAEAAEAFRDTPLDATKVAASISTLKQFPRTLRAEVEAELRTQLAALDAELLNDARPAAARLRNALTLVKEKLDRRQLDAAVGSFDAARLQYAVLLAANLRARVSSETPPAGMVDADWRSLRQEIETAVRNVEATSDADEAMTRAKAAMRDYLRLVVVALRSAARQVGDAAKAKAVNDELNAVETSLGDDKLTLAWQHLDAAQDAYKKAVVPTGRPMGAQERSAIDALTAAASGGAVGGAAFDIIEAIDVAPSSGFLEIPGAVRRIADRLTFLDVLTSVVVLVVATLVGLQMLWVDNPTWGGWASYLAAFGWGFALDQFTVAGIAALRAAR